MEPPLSFKSYIQDIQTQLGQILMAFFRKHHGSQAQADAMLASQFAAFGGAYKTPTDIRFLMRVVSHNWLNYAKVYINDPSSSVSRVKNVLQLLHAGAHESADAGNMTWNDIAGMRSDLEVFLTMLAEPLNKDFALPAASTLRDQVPQKWRDLDTSSSKGPFASPQILISPVSAGASASGIEFHIDNLVDVSKEDLHAIIDSACGYAPKSIVLAPSPIPGANAYVVGFCTASELHKAKEELASMWPDAIINPVGGEGTDAGFILYDLDCNDSVKQKLEVLLKARKISVKSLVLDSSVNEIVVLFEKNATLTAPASLTVSGQSTTCVPFSPYRLKFSSLPPDATKESLTDLIAAAAPGAVPSYLYLNASLRYAVGHFNDGAYHVLAALKTISLGATATPSTTEPTAAASPVPQAGLGAVPSGDSVAILVRDLKKPQYMAFAKSISDALRCGHVHIFEARQDALMRLPLTQAQQVLDPLFKVPSFSSVSFSVAPADWIVFSSSTHKRFAQLYCAYNFLESASRLGVHIVDKDASSSLLYIRQSSGQGELESPPPVDVCNQVQTDVSRILRDVSAFSRPSMKLALDGLTYHHVSLLGRETLQLVEAKLAPAKCAVTAMSTKSSKMTNAFFATFFYVCQDAASAAAASAFFSSLKPLSRDVVLHDRKQVDAVSNVDLQSFVASHGVKFVLEQGKLTCYGFLDATLTGATSSLIEILKQYSSADSIRADASKVYFLLRHRADVDVAVAKVDPALSDVKIFYNTNAGTITLSGPGDAVQKVKAVIQQQLHSIHSAAVGKALHPNLWHQLSRHVELQQNFVDIGSKSDDPVMLFIPVIRRSQLKTSRGDAQRGGSVSRGSWRGSPRGGRGGGMPKNKKSERSPTEFVTPCIVSHSAGNVQAAKVWLDRWVQDVQKHEELINHKFEAGLIKRILYELTASRRTSKRAAKASTSSSSSSQSQSDDESNSDSDDSDSESGDSSSHASSDSADTDDSESRTNSYEPAVFACVRQLNEIPVVALLKKVENGSLLRVFGRTADVKSFVARLRDTVGSILIVTERVEIPKEQRNKKLVFQVLMTLDEEIIKSLKRDLQLKDVKFFNPKQSGAAKKVKFEGKPAEHALPSVVLTGRRNSMQEAKTRILGWIKEIQFVEIPVGIEDLPRIIFLKQKLAEKAEADIFVYSIPYLSADAKGPKQAIRLAGLSLQTLQATAQWIGSIKIEKRTLQQRPEIDPDMINRVKAQYSSGPLQKTCAAHGARITFPVYPPRIEVEGCGEAVDEIVELLESIISKERASRELPLDSVMKRIVLSGKRWQSLVAIATANRCRLFRRDEASDFVITLSGSSSDIEAAFNSVKKEVDKWKSDLRSETLEVVPKGLSLQAVCPTSKLEKLAQKTGVTISGKQSDVVLGSFSVGQAGKTVEVVVGSIVRQKVDAIVNAANTKLDHMGGVARVIADAAGPNLTQASKDLTANGPIKSGSAIVTPAFDLKNCQHIIHAVGPIWSGGGSNEEALLKACIESVIREAARLNLRSIAIPAISSGIFGFPLQKAVSTITAAVISALESPHSGSVSLVRFVDIKADAARSFALEMSNRYGSSADVSQMFQTPHQEPATKISHVWYWRENDGSFKPFDPDQNLQIEKAFAAGEKSVEVTGDLNKVQNGYRYLVNLDELWEINLSFKNNKRPIRRDPIKPEQRAQYDSLSASSSSSSAPQVPASLMASLSSPKPKLSASVGSDKDAVANNCVKVVGLKDDIEIFRQEVLKLVRSSMAEFTIEAATLGDQLFSPEKRANIESICTMHSLIVDFSADWRSVTVKGEKDSLAKAQLDIISKLKGNHLAYPETWSQQKNNLDLFDVPSNTPEFVLVLEKIRKTLPQAQLIKLQRIQNKIMWKSFVSKREVLAEKNAKQSDEAWVFHGTRQTSPADIYSSPEGFNLGFASNGMWGTGLYFAVNSSYSGNGYHHPLPNNQRQMFLVRLLLGEVIDMPSTPSLRVPPEMSAGSSAHLGLKVNRYDTVSGETGGSRVYIVYDNNRAYPEYLLTFSV